MERRHLPLKRQYSYTFTAGIIYSLLLIAWGFSLNPPLEILAGLRNIIHMQDMLITDYCELSCVGATLVNSGICTIIGLLVVKFSNTPYNGYTIVKIGLLSGFAMFGKNFINILPIIFGGWLHARYVKKPFSNYATLTLLTTTLAPLVSYMVWGFEHASPALGILTGISIGFVIPALTTYTATIQHGMNLYNAGFACGLFAFLFVSVLTVFNFKPETVLIWATGLNHLFAPALFLLCTVLILLGLFGCKVPVKTVLFEYRRLIATSGRVPCDYLVKFGIAPVLVNIGLTGMIGTAYILLIGGDLNGPTLGGILTIMGFAAIGKHPVNIIPIIAGIALGSYLHHTPTHPSLQLAALFGTTLAPISGHFGWPYGILAGFLHSALVLQTGGVTGGVNLYNNGFTAGLIVIVLYPIISAVRKSHEPKKKKYREE
jgi:hypothetical protein